MVLLYKNIFYGVFIIFMQEATASKGKKDNDCKNWNMNYYPKKGENLVKVLHLILSCDKKSKLLDIDVVAGKHVLPNFDDAIFDKETMFVYGYTPSLMININLCYWSQGCIITFPRDVMFSCVSINSTDGKCGIVRPNDDWNNEASCFLKDAEFLRPVSAKCVKRELVQTIFNMSSLYPASPTKLPRRKGILKSHDTYPWNYDGRYRNLSYKYRFKLGKKVLIFGLKFVHVCDGDSLRLKTKHNTTDIAYLEENTQLAFTRKRDKYVEFEFQISRDSSGCGGFLICYQRVRAKALRTYGKGKKNVCDDIIKKTAKLEKQDHIKP